MSKKGDITLSQALASQSKTFREANPMLFGVRGGEPIQNGPKTLQIGVVGVLNSKTGQRSGKGTGKRRREMNKLEASFSRLLQSRRHRGEIVSYEYEGLTLRWADGMVYTADFKVVTSVVSPTTENEGAAQRITLIEVKGSYCWQKDLVKFRAARAAWPLYRFEFWQKVDGIWQITR